MENKKIAKSFTLTPQTINKLSEEKNSSALVQLLLEKHYEDESKTYEQKILESEIIGLDKSIKRTFKEYLYSLNVSESGDFKESEHSLVYMENMKHLKKVFLTLMMNLRNM